MKHWYYHLGSEDIPERTLEPPDDIEEPDPAQEDEYEEEEDGGQRE